MFLSPVFYVYMFGMSFYITFLSKLGPLATMDGGVSIGARETDRNVIRCHARHLHCLPGGDQVRSQTPLYSPTTCYLKELKKPLQTSEI